MHNIINVGRDGDIKIEDNMGEQDGDFDDNLSPSKFEDEESLDLGTNPYIAHGGILKRQSNHGEIQQKSRAYVEKQKHMLQNLTDLEIDEEGNVFQPNLIEELKLDEQHENNTVGDGQGKNQNKICFGVFASISHQFNLRTEKWATEVSTAL